MPYIFLAVLALPLTYLAFTLFERYEEEVDLGWSFEAQRNPYLAAEQFLEQVGAEVDSSYQLDIIDQLSADATLFISDANAVLNARRADALVGWMKSGGHVIIAAQILPEGQRDVFLDRFGVTKYSERNAVDFFNLNGEEPDDEETEEEQKRISEILREQNEELQDTRAREREREKLKEEGELNTVADELNFEERRFSPADIMRLRFNDMQNEIRVLLDREEYLRHVSIYEEEYVDISSDDVYQGDYEPFYWQGTESGIGYMQFEVDDGLLTVLSDATIWTSDRIGLFDHAYLLALLTESSDSVIFLYGAVVPGLFDLLWQHFFELCIALLLILTLWLFYRSRRFGPILDSSELGRRSFREHLSAVGDFFWRHQQRNSMLNAVREAIWNELRAKHFAATGYNDHEKLEKLAELVNETPTELCELMTGPAPDDEFNFFQHVRSLQKIRKQL
ncbi:MAG: DUF4350 domain-containing protein [Cellvibrionaceae bacterium]